MYINHCIFIRRISTNRGSKLRQEIKFEESRPERCKTLFTHINVHNRFIFFYKNRMPAFLQGIVSAAEVEEDRRYISKQVECIHIHTCTYKQTHVSMHFCWQAIKVCAQNIASRVLQTKAEIDNTAEQLVQLGNIWSYFVCFNAFMKFFISLYV